MPAPTHTVTYLCVREWYPAGGRRRAWLSTIELYILGLVGYHCSRLGLPRVPGYPLSYPVGYPFNELPDSGYSRRVRRYVGGLNVFRLIDDTDDSHYSQWSAKTGRSRDTHDDDDRLLVGANVIRRSSCYSLNYVSAASTPATFDWQLAGATVTASWVRRTPWLVGRWVTSLFH